MYNVCYTVFTPFIPSSTWRTYKCCFSTIKNWMNTFTALYFGQKYLALISTYMYALNGIKMANAHTLYIASRVDFTQINVKWRDSKDLVYFCVHVYVPSRSRSILQQVHDTTSLCLSHFASVWGLHALYLHGLIQAVVAANLVVAPGARVDDILAAADAEWDEAASQPEAVEHR